MTDSDTDNHARWISEFAGVGGIPDGCVLDLDYYGEASRAKLLSNPYDPRIAVGYLNGRFFPLKAPIPNPSDDDYNRVHVRLEFSFACDLVGYGGLTFAELIEGIKMEYAPRGLVANLGDGNGIKIVARHRGELESWEIDG